MTRITTQTKIYSTESLRGDDPLADSDRAQISS